MKNFYHILGLSFESKPEKSLIEAAYKALVKLYHPDIYDGPNKDLKRKISEINEAYDTLSNLAKKEIYDKLEIYEHKIKKLWNEYFNTVARSLAGFICFVAVSYPLRKYWVFK